MANSNGVIKSEAECHLAILSSCHQESRFFEKKGKNIVVGFRKLKCRGEVGLLYKVTGKTWLGHFLVLIAISGYNVPCSKLLVSVSQF